MKSKALFLIFLIFVFSSCDNIKNIFSKNHSVQLTISFSFKGILPGYDHKNKIQVFIDGNLAGESSVMSENQPNTFTLTVSKGNHLVKIIDLVSTADKWEEHTKANGYSVDCLYEKTIDFKADQTLRIIFDIDKGTMLE